MSTTKVQIEFCCKPVSVEVSKREGFGYHVHSVTDYDGRDMTRIAPLVDFMCQGAIAEILEEVHA